jgi:phosphate transport system permease protein
MSIEPHEPSKALTGDGARLRKFSHRFVIWSTGGAAVVPLIGLIIMLVILIREALPVIRFNGWGFFTTSNWFAGNPYGTIIKSGGIAHLPGEHFGALALILGTVETTAIAVAVALPISIGAAVLLVERLPARVGAVLGLALEILAGIPSVVIGLWGIFSFGPFLASHIYPVLNKLPNVPVLSIFRASFTPNGQGLLTGGLVLSAMIVPLMAATTRDLLRQVPTLTKEGAEALGMTGAEAFMTVQARWVRAGVVGAAVLGVGRALGETIAIALVTGSVIQLAPSLYGSMTTIAAGIVSQLDFALSDPTGLSVRSLAEAALVLMVISLTVNTVARNYSRRAARSAGLPTGRGAE